MQATSDVVTLHSRAAADAQRVVDNVQTEDLSQSTPCSEWDVQTVLQHVITLNQAAARQEESPADPTPVPRQHDANVVADFAAATRAASVAFSAPGAMEQPFTMPWGEIKGEALAQVLAMDLMIHAWDAAKATGQATDMLDPELCQTALEMGQAMMTDAYRTPESGFGPEVSVPADAPICDRMAAFYGRQP